MRGQPKDSGYVYLAKMGNYFKIGYSKSPEDRMRTMVGVMLPPEYRVTLVFSVVRKSARLIENLLHRKFVDTRVAGEWFRLTVVQVGDAIEFMKHGTLRSMKHHVEGAGAKLRLVPASVVCPHCSYQWLSKTTHPVKCPECQRRWPLGRPKGK